MNELIANQTQTMHTNVKLNIEGLGREWGTINIKTIDIHWKLVITDCFDQFSIGFEVLNMPIVFRNAYFSNKELRLHDFKCTGHEDFKLSKCNTSKGKGLYFAKPLEITLDFKDKTYWIKWED